MRKNSSSKIIIGIDPGSGGGIAVFSGKQLLNSTGCPDTVQKMSDYLRSLINSLELEGIPISKIIVYIEKVHAFPTDARNSAFKFGRNFGMWLGICSTLKLTTIKVPPQTWMKHFNVPKMDKPNRKKYLKNIARTSFPKEKITLKTCDAILIAKYGYAQQLIKE
tara:strand:+ start:72 stop:563 length:492 start_codon:yes stop_codon:yes gene_type:complete